MSALPIAKPQEIGVEPERWQRACDLLKGWADSGKVPAAALCVGRKGKMLEPRFFGKQRPDADAPLRKDALFLTASITKPVTATAFMMLVERGLLRLEDPVAEYVPKFAAKGKKDVLIRHLLTHTSGLPDMLPNNEALRAAHKPLSAFVDATCEVELLFPPGTKVSYQSMGILMLAEILHQRAGTTLREFLRKEVFDPLGMADTSLGWQAEKKERIAAVHISDEQRKTDWNWNTPYWLGFGAPWGGMIASPADFARFCQTMLNGGALGDVRLLSPAGVRAMTTNQFAAMPSVPEEERRCRPWGLGWKLNWPAHVQCFGDLLGPRAYGHWGATGTLCWLDPDAEAYFILFTTEPKADEGRYLVRVSNAVAAAFM
jgi:CubicO group peptidase (beta-lactamase class C family)